MLTKQIAGFPASATDPSLHCIVRELIEEAAPQAISNRNSVINEIPTSLHIQGNKRNVSSVLSNLVNTVVLHTKNSGILISAKVYGFVILVQVRTNGLISPLLQAEMETTAQKAKRSGGVIELMQHQEDQASVAYCFLNVEN
jgi:hypothetical protein